MEKVVRKWIGRQAPAHIFACLALAVAFPMLIGCAGSKQLAEKVVPERRGARYSDRSLLVFYDAKVGKEPLQKALGKLKCEVVYEYRLSCGFAISVPKGKSVSKVSKQLAGVKGVTQVMRDELLTID